MFSVGKSTTAGKKYASAAGGAGNKLQLWMFFLKHKMIKLTNGDVLDQAQDKKDNE